MDKMSSYKESDGYHNIMELNYFPHHNKINFVKISHPRICKKEFYTVFEEKINIYSD